MKISRLLASLVLVALIAVVYGQILRHDFVNYDDNGYVTGNPIVLRGLTLEGFFWAFTTNEAANWHPLTWLSHMLDVQLFGLWPGGHHLMNLLFHAAASVMLFLLLNGLTGAFWRSWMVAGLFAVHPLHVESVAWIAERKDVLSACFWMLTMGAYLRYTKHPGGARYAMTTASFALGLLAKPMLVTLPLVLLLLDFWPLGRFLRLSKAGNGLRSARFTAFRLAWEKLPLILLAAGSTFMTFFAQRSRGAMRLMDIIPLSVRAMNAVTSYAKYMLKMLWPNSMSIFYPHPGRSLPAWSFALALILLVWVTFLAITLGRRHCYLFVGWFWYLITLMPVIGLIQVGLQAMADRYTYIPFIGLFVMIVWSAHELTARLRFGPALIAIGSALALSALSLAAWAQAGYWKDSASLMGHAIAVNPQNYVAHNMLGVDYMLQGRMAEAGASFRESTRLKPDYGDPIYNLGLVYKKLGKVDKAIDQYSQLLAMFPGDIEARYNLANLLSSEGRINEAIEHYRQAAKIEPRRTDIRNELGLLLSKQGRLEEAGEELKVYINLKPKDPKGFYNLGMVQDMKGEIVSAMANYRKALLLDPGFADAHNNLGVDLAQTGAVAEAAYHFGQALRIEPTNNRASQNLEILLQQGNKVK